MKPKEYHELFAARVIEQMKAGTAPWMKPWAPGQSPESPMNFSTERHYRGGNHLFLAMSGFSDPRWGTFKQIRAAGGCVTKGSKGSPILFFGRSSHTLKDDDGKVVKDDDGKTVYVESRTGPAIHKLYYVFNVLAQSDGIELEPLTPPGELTWDPITEAEKIISASGVPYRHLRGDRACYSPTLDRVTMPEKDQFSEALDYYQTALHELIHATGHESRLDRKKGNAFGSQDYAREELRAEIGAMMAGEQSRVGSRPQHGAAYVASWIQALKDDPSEIYRAAADAERAAGWLIDRAEGQSSHKAAA